MRVLFFCLIFAVVSFLNAQTFLADMPEPVSNNAVTGAEVNGIAYMFSFSGIDSTKKWDGIHKRAFRYNIDTDVWETIAELPSGTGRIAAGASTVKNKIYIMGGYEVFANGNERTLDEVHIYNPETNEYEPNGKPIPVPVDDHVQVVYKDSLIICVTGWSQTTNVPNVQIYNPSLDEWSVGTSVITGFIYRAFGASGAVVGDTLYYLGGARIGSNFPASNYFRKGYINPNDPTDITWSAKTDPLSIRYRSACSTIDNTILWFGGSQLTYNYDGIAYNNSGGVAPNGNSINYNPTTGKINEGPISFPDFMDYRGLSKVAENYYFCGGMESNQKVSNKTFFVKGNVASANLVNKQNIEIFPNPVTDQISIKTKGKFDAELFDFYGKSIFKNEYHDNAFIPVAHLVSGLYILKTTKNKNLVFSDIIVLK